MWGVADDFPKHKSSCGSSRRVSKSEESHVGVQQTIFQIQSEQEDVEDDAYGTVSLTKVKMVRTTDEIKIKGLFIYMCGWWPSKSSTHSSSWQTSTLQIQRSLGDIPEYVPDPKCLIQGVADVFPNLASSLNAQQTILHIHDDIANAATYCLLKWKTFLLMTVDSSEDISFAIGFNTEQEAHRSTINKPIVLLNLQFNAYMD